MEGGGMEGVTRVLLVDDSPVDRKVVELVLGSNTFAGSFHVIAVDSAKKAMEFLGLKDGKEQAIDMVLTDYCMPEMTGYDLLKAIKATSPLKPIPVVVMSSENEPQRISRCLKAGAEDYSLRSDLVDSTDKFAKKTSSLLELNPRSTSPPHSLSVAERSPASLSPSPSAPPAPPPSTSPPSPSASPPSTSPPSTSPPSTSPPSSSSRRLIPSSGFPLCGKKPFFLRSRRGRARSGDGVAYPVAGKLDAVAAMQESGGSVGESTMESWYTSRRGIDHGECRGVEVSFSAWMELVRLSLLQLLPKFGHTAATGELPGELKLVQLTEIK